MTTKVTITCQENSHWDIAVITQDQQWDPEARMMTTVWADTSTIVLGPGESTKDMYVHSSRRFVVEERVRS